MQYGSSIEAGFGGATQFAGGGFMSSHAESPGQRKQASQNTPETMRSVTVAQLKKVEMDSSDQAIYDGAPVKNVTIVAKIVSKTVTNTFLELQMYDGTGTIGVKMHMDLPEPEAAVKIGKLQEGKYVRVHGHWKNSIEGTGTFADIYAFEIRPVTDHNEVVYHNLEVIFQHQYLTRGQNSGAVANTGALGNPVMQQQPVQRQNPAVAPLQPQGRPQGPGGAYQAVLEYLRSDAVLAIEHGAHLSQITQALGGRYSEMDLKRSLEQAMNDGHCYTTTDEYTYKFV